MFISWHDFSMASEIAIHEEGVFSVGTVPSPSAYSLYPHANIPVSPYNNG